MGLLQKVVVSVFTARHLSTDFLAVDTLIIIQVLPYIIDLGSANGTYLNNQKIEAQRYVELKEKDVLKFGYSSREYVLLHENSDGGD